jgi:hypothetical protein
MTLVYQRAERPTVPIAEQRVAQSFSNESRLHNAHWVGDIAGGPGGYQCSSRTVSLV